MRKRSTSFDTLQLGIELLRRIPKSGSTTARVLQAQLADRGFPRNIRTIERHLDVLSRHFDIARDDTGIPYRYRWSPHAKGMSLPALSPHECLLLCLAEQQLRPLLPPKVLKSLASFFDQAYAQLRTEPSGQRERDWLNKVRVVSTTQPLLPPKINDSTFEQVCSALYGDLWLDVAYLNAAWERVQGRVMPLGLVQQGPRMYLVCRFHGFTNERHLALHRITSAHATSFNFRRPVAFDLKKYDEESRFGFGQGKLIRLTFRIEKDAGRHLLESPLSKDQHVSELKKHFEVTASVHDSLMLDWWLRGFGKAVTRISKAELIHR